MIDRVEGDAYVVLGISRDADDETIYDTTADPSPGPLDLLSQASLCSQASLLVAPDSGLLHLASAMHTPVVGIYEAESAIKTEPRGPRRILHLSEGLAPEQVLVAARDLIGL